MTAPRDYTERLERDVFHLVDFCTRRRTSDGAALAVCARIYRQPDAAAIASLMDAIEDGAYTVRELRAICRLRYALVTDHELTPLLTRLRDGVIPWRAPREQGF